MAFPVFRHGYRYSFTFNDQAYAKLALALLLVVALVNIGMVHPDSLTDEYLFWKAAS